MTLRAGLRAAVRRLMNHVGYDLIRTDPGQRYQIDDIPGWFTANEARLLYTTTALVRPQRLLEIGTFLGRSTASIALAIRDGGFTCAFTSVDFDFADEPAFRARFPTVHGKPATMPAEYRLAFDRGLTTSAYARTLLQQQRLDSLVTLVSGDFQTVATGPYDLIMADCLHDHDEITRNAPAIARLMSPGGVLAVHDATPANRALLLTLVPAARFIAAEDSLAIYRLT
jgi:predicted O-methyltransferase YrrM